MKTIIAFVLVLMIYMAMLTSSKPSPKPVIVTSSSNCTDSLEITVEKIEWPQGTLLIVSDDKWYMPVNATIENVSKDTIKFVNWTGNPSARFTTDNENIFVVWSLTRNNLYMPYSLAPGEAYVYRLHIAMHEWNSIYIKYRIGFDWVKPALDVEGETWQGFRTVLNVNFRDHPSKEVPFKTFWSAPIWLF